uniref:Uncharacterized protein n=1 Tax=Solanum tuberosum TaxID=4113 RepID=M1BWA9_SOLTU
MHANGVIHASKAARLFCTVSLPRYCCWKNIASETDIRTSNHGVRHLITNCMLLDLAAVSSTVDNHL